LHPCLAPKIIKKLPQRLMPKMVIDYAYLGSFKKNPPGK